MMKWSKVYQRHWEVSQKQDKNFPLTINVEGNGIQLIGYKRMENNMFH
ncbi:hypothetical protein [Bacillus thuringiensis]